MAIQSLLTVAQFRDRYAISHTAFYRQVNEGRLRITKIGRSTRILQADADAWLASLATVGSEGGAK